MRQARSLIVLFFPLLMTSSAYAQDNASNAPVVASKGVMLDTQDVCERPESVIDGDAATECTFTRNPALAGNVDVGFCVDLGAPHVVESLRITNGHTKPVRWLLEVEVSADGGQFRPLLGRYINLPMWRGGDSIDIPLPPSVGRYVRVRFGGVREGGVSEIALSGRPNRPERHVLCWAGNLQEDYLDKLDYYEKELAATDLWLDQVDTGFPQTNTNSGFQIWRDANVFEQFKQRGLRYWLCEHEAFTFMVNSPEVLHSDIVWQTTLAHMRVVYQEARALGFRGIVFDAEDYDGVTQEANDRYKDKADHVDAWCFVDECGYAGGYYQRGREVGRIIAEAWPEAILMQLYEARMYVGIPGCRDGNYWWLKGIRDGGVVIWVATEKTYGAGNGELDTAESPDYLTKWFVDMREFIPRAHQAFPFAARILPGFHPWNSRTKSPNYLPKYLDEQLTLAEGLTQGYWLYCEGNPHAGDPRDVLDRDVCAKFGVAPEDYLKVFAQHATSRTQEPPKQ